MSINPNDVSVFSGLVGAQGVSLDVRRFGTHLAEVETADDRIGYGGMGAKHLDMTFV